MNQLGDAWWKGMILLYADSLTFHSVKTLPKDCMVESTVQESNQLI